MADPVALRSDGLSALIDPLGAELVSLKDAQGRELMTDADPAFWTGHAPILFPIVGRLNGDVLRIDGRDYPMKQHGFARRMVFEVVAHDDSGARFRLTANDETRAVYPFDFALDVAFTLRDATLAIDVSVHNRGDVPMPASLGFHPAFAWPLPYDQRREDHRIAFDGDEPGAIVELDDGLFAATRPSPLDGRLLHLADDLFADDALIWDPVRSSGVTYGATVGPRLRIDFPDTPYLGIWTKPGAAFVCIEPWHGHADPVGFTGDFHDKPGVFEVAPGAERTCSMQVTLLP
ncbi:aldose 1-epimerase family protein [Sphingomonas panacisoli]|uniref:Aldose 1-epimerase family protein n=1 Tax=Sphingomonas panacisoli TaxID=1813879 RepID=A0A5B8LEG1_9SPHN|nr:aldose 1-epimerase family protein [Sphingomonas panacisoli]QDZ06134.1 aldose 1-epimerase family protein [Sphingomonas panacisoli]